MERTGRAQAVTVISPLRRWWAAWLRLSWPLADRMPFVKWTLVRLAFIHAAHWSLVTRVPAAGRGSDARPLPYPYMIFHSNFNDDIAAYIDAFALVVPWRMRLCWHGAYDFPGPRVVDRFLRFVQDQAVPAQHYYCAYPEGSSRMIADALELSEHHRAFVRAAQGLDDAGFAGAWQQFVDENQRLL